MKNQSESKKTGNFHIYPGEIKDITISILAISLAVLIAINTHTQTDLFSDLSIFLLFYISFIFTIGVGFVLHELAHKAVAMHYGADARFVKWNKGIIFMFITSFLGFVFAAPGAVYIFAKRITKKQNGIISLAGPLMNLILSIMFFMFYIISPANYFPINIWIFGAYINAMLATFNLIPIYPLDGSKVIKWNFWIWVASMIISFTIMSNMGGALV